MKRLLLMICILSFLFCSCILDILDLLSSEDLSLGKDEYWALNMISGKPYKLKAEPVYEGEYCEILVEVTRYNYSATVNEAKTVADIYDTHIYPKMTEAFGNDFNIGGNIYNTMEAADYLGNKDGKLSILLLDIKDGYKEGSGYVGGYFDSRNFFKTEYSNNRDMIYIDTNPLEPGKDSSIEIIAHEMQHLMNFVTRNRLGYNHMDLWINEGLSTAAERLVTANLGETRIKDYNENLGGTIDKGNNFFVWDNYNEKDPRTKEPLYPNAVLDDYSTVFMFFQWLRFESGKGMEVYKDIMKSEYSDYRAVTSNAGNYDLEDWGDLLRDWYIANYTGYSGGDIEFRSLTKHYIAGGAVQTGLYPGEGVLSYASSLFSVPVQEGVIKYAGMTSGLFPILEPAGIPAGGALLTYNESTVMRRNSDGTYTANKTPGKITGNTPPASASVSPGARSILGYIKPYPVSAGEMLRRNSGTDNE